MSFQNLQNKYSLPLICAASVSRSEQFFRKLLSLAKRKKVTYSKLYEALLQNYLFAGYPSAIISLKILKEYFPNVSHRTADDMNLYHFKKLGEQNCKLIYGKKFEKLISNVNHFSPEISSWLVLEGYGKVLSRKGLSLKERELCIVSVLSILRFEDQLYSHISGAVRTGAKLIEIESVIENLKLINKNRESRFGRRVFAGYIKEKGVQ